LNWLCVLIVCPPARENALSMITVVSLAINTTPENPLSACARAIAANRAGLCAAPFGTTSASPAIMARLAAR
jgi:hypothetical protein